MGLHTHYTYYKLSYKPIKHKNSSTIDNDSTTSPHAIIDTLKNRFMLTYSFVTCTTMQDVM